MSLYQTWYQDSNPEKGPRYSEYIYIYRKKSGSRDQINKSKASEDSSIPFTIIHIEANTKYVRQKFKASPFISTSNQQSRHRWTKEMSTTDTFSIQSPKIIMLCNYYANY